MGVSKMTELSSAVQTLLSAPEDWGRSDFRRAYDQLSPEDQKVYQEVKKASYFVPENKIEGTEKEYFSPSGKYRLVVEGYGTKGGWNYSQGTLYRVGDDTPIVVIQRNYGSFPKCWIEGHTNGHDYFMGGSDYQGQTLVELDTGARLDVLSEGADAGHGFCWVQVEYLPDHQLLMVDGCIWACPYEYRLYSFADPMSGWPELKVFDKDGEESCIYVGGGKPIQVEQDGTFTVYEIKDIYDYKERYGVEDVSDVVWQGPVPEDPDDDERYTNVSSITYKIQDGKVLYHSEWVSEKEAEYLERCRISNEAYEAKLKAFKESDPLYLAYRECLKDPTLIPEKYCSRGVIYSGWCPDYKGVSPGDKNPKYETRWCHTIYKAPVKDKYSTSVGYTLEIEWGIDNGPVRLDIYKNGKSCTPKFWMDHSVESIQAAFAYAKELILSSFELRPGVQEILEGDELVRSTMWSIIEDLRKLFGIDTPLAIAVTDPSEKTIMVLVKTDDFETTSEVLSKYIESTWNLLSDDARRRVGVWIDV